MHSRWWFWWIYDMFILYCGICPPPQSADAIINYCSPSLHTSMPRRLVVRKFLLILCSIQERTTSGLSCFVRNWCRCKPYTKNSVVVIAPSSLHVSNLPTCLLLGRCWFDLSLSWVKSVSCCHVLHLSSLLFKQPLLPDSRRVNFTVMIFLLFDTILEDFLLIPSIHIVDIYVNPLPSEVDVKLVPRRAFILIRFTSNCEILTNRKRRIN